MNYHVDRTAPPHDHREVFVFGSNLMGIHGKGAALEALRYGARFGTAVGPCGHSYAIPTKKDLRTVLTKAEIRGYVEDFLAHARAHPEQRFFVTRIGCGYAGYKDADIAPMFALAPDNCDFAESWRPYLEDIRI